MTAQTSSSAQSKGVFRRRVFYVPGFDPFPPRRYRELYRREGARQAQLSGYALSLARAAHAPVSGARWRVCALMGGQPAEAEIEVLDWRDIVRNRMPRSVFGTYGLLVRTLWVYFSTGAALALMRVRLGPMLAGLYPVGMMALQFAFAVGVGYGLFRATVSVWGGDVPTKALGALGGGLASLALLEGFRRADRWLFAYYLLAELAQSALHRGGFGPDLEERLAAFADKVKAARSEPWDEVLVVGHSSGAALAVAVVAMARAGSESRLEGPFPSEQNGQGRGHGSETEGQSSAPLPSPTRATAGAARAPLALLTLGQVIPLHSFLPEAKALRRALRELACARDLAWVDVSAPGDGGCFALADPVALSGVRPPDARWPRIVSAAFRQTLARESYRRLRWRFYALHFQYLCAFERPGDYDYFAITAGPITLAERFAARPDSPQTIRRALSPHQTLA